MKKKDLTQRLREEEQWKVRNNLKIFAYNNLSEDQKRDPKILEFPYKKRFLQEIKK